MFLKMSLAYSKFLIKTEFSMVLTTFNFGFGNVDCFHTNGHWNVVKVSFYVTR